MGNERRIFIEIFRFLRDWDNHAATIFDRSQPAYLENMPEPRAWGAESLFEIGTKSRTGYYVMKVECNNINLLMCKLI